MIASLLYRATRALLSVPAVLLRRDKAKDAELLVLRHENAVLRRQLNDPLRYEPADRFWLAALSSLLPRNRWRTVVPVTPATLLTGAPQTDRQEVGLHHPTPVRRASICPGRAREVGAALGGGEPATGATVEFRASWPGWGIRSHLSWSRKLGRPV